jgi:FKBP-type peptidyl-prolyl cis-trans isomerase 2
MLVRVREIRDGTAVLDLNHPLAGRTLVFEVRVILVEPP